jgi:menaquinone-specific isochorismate synthase
VSSPLRVRTRAADPAVSLLDVVPDPSGVVWVRDGEGLVGWGEALRVDVGGGPDRFRRAWAALTGLFGDMEIDDEVGAPGTGPVAFGSVTFDPRGSSSLVVPEVVVGRRDDRAWTTVVGDAPTPSLASQPPPPAPERIRFAGSSMPDVHWLEAVATAVTPLASGEIEKVVLARDHAVWSRAPFDARALAVRLADRYPACFTFACDGLVGATPELLVRRFGRTVESLVLAGTAPRGTDPEDDEERGRALQASAKDRAEHVPAVASVREALAPRSRSLDVDAEPWLLRLANVQHLATGIRGELADPSGSALELAGALHPTAAVGGRPTAAALALIRKLEGMDRGRYAGPVGWVDARGDGEWGIALRCAELSGARARLFAGSGIVADSLPEAELEETRLKLRAMQSAFAG